VRLFVKPFAQRSNIECIAEGAANLADQNSSADEQTGIENNSSHNLSSPD
jgi:hypothetical protein